MRNLFWFSVLTLGLTYEDEVDILEGLTHNAIKKGVSEYGKAKGVPEHGKTIAYERSPLNCTCPDTYYLIDDRCERAIQFDQQTVCPSNYIQVNSTSCVRQSFPEERCPIGYARVKTECVRREVTIPQLLCPEGYAFETAAHYHKLFSNHEELVCSRRVDVEPIQECPDGTPYKGQCITSTLTPASYFCPPGFIEAAANTCYREHEVICSNTKGHHMLRKLTDVEESFYSNVATSFGVQRDGDISNHEFLGNAASSDEEQNYVQQYSENMYSEHSSSKTKDKDTPKVKTYHGGGGGGYYATFNDETPSEKPTHPEMWKHWKGNNQLVEVRPKTLTVTQSCNANVTIPAEPYCPNGGRLQGLMCVEPLPVQPILVCPAYGSIGDCFTFDRTNPRASCPEDYVEGCRVSTMGLKKMIDCDCTKTETTEVQLLCPPGATFTDGMCTFVTSTYRGCPPDSRPVGGDLCERLEHVPCVCTYTVNFACQGASCHHHVLEPKKLSHNKK